jgi:hypothetical protein
MSAALVRAAQDAGAAASRGEVSDRNAAGATARALQTAAENCRRAAQMLGDGRRAAELFVQRNVGVASGNALASGSTHGTSRSQSPVDSLEQYGLVITGTESGGYNFLAHTDAAGTLGSQVGAVPGYKDVVIHGNASSLGSHDGPDLPIPLLADVIRSQPDYSGGPVRLLACSAGASGSGPAQELANALGEPVLAASDTIHLVRRSSGVVMTVGPNPFTNTGQWRIFYPERDN